MAMDSPAKQESDNGAKEWGKDKEDKEDKSDKSHGFAPAVGPAAIGRGPAVGGVASSASRGRGTMKAQLPVGKRKRSPALPPEKPKQERGQSDEEPSGCKRWRRQSPPHQRPPALTPTESPWPPPPCAKPPRAPSTPRMEPSCAAVLRLGPGSKGNPAVGSESGEGGKGHRGKGKPAVGGEGGDRSKGKGKPAVGGEGGGGKGQQDLFQPGFWFGHDYQLNIDGPEVCGRYIKAKNLLRRIGLHRPLPRVFHAGGDPSARRGKGHTKSQPLAASSSDQRVDAVMGLVQLHEGEYRQWHKAWGDYPGGTMDWQRFRGPAPLPGHPFWSHHQLQLRPVTSGIPSSLDHARQFRPMSPLQYFTGSTILRSASGKLLEAAYESRNVFIVNLPEILLHRMWTHTAAEVYDRWSECEVIIGKRPRRGRGKNC